MAVPHEDGTQARPSERPQPAYGELAPEGWEWTPEANDDSRGGTSSLNSSAPGSPVTGVPHNLGARGDASGAPAPASPAAPSTGAREPEPYRGDAPPAPRDPAPRQTPSYAPENGYGAAQQKPRTADRVITIILLVLGMFGSLNFAASMMSLPASFSLMGSAFELENFSVPSWVGTVGTVTAIAIFAIFAVSLIFSIQRMRARKLAFWVPLTAGAIVVIGTIIVTTAVLFNVPELMSAASDPTAMQKLLDSLSEMSQP
ncbi:DUF6264 family protein [Leucobacter sp. USCH14]|uniref:DUF6264 family protein n=1 Tax=Leucobacter sp. USCH14 TaxID=3024838 RepID=UPI00309855BD